MEPCLQLRIFCLERSSNSEQLISWQALSPLSYRGSVAENLLKVRVIKDITYKSDLESDIKNDNSEIVLMHRIGSRTRGVIRCFRVEGVSM